MGSCVGAEDDAVPERHLEGVDDDGVKDATAGWNTMADHVPDLLSDGPQRRVTTAESAVASFTLLADVAE